MTNAKRLTRGFGGGYRCASVLLLCVLTLAARAGAEIVTGTYTGNGASSRTIGGVGFWPDVVIIKGDIAESAVIRTSTMPSGQTKQLAQDQPLLANRITGFTSDGFTISSSPDVNASGVEYGWVAFSSDPGFMTVGSYTGSGSGSQSVNGLGFAPVAVFVMPGDSDRPRWRTSAMPDGESMAFDAEGLRTDLITSFLSDGFRVGSDGAINGLYTTYHYVAWAGSPASLAVGSYVGDGQTKQDVHGMGFTPEWAMVKAGEGLPGVQKPQALGGDKSGFFNQEVYSTNALKKVEGDGIEVGSDYRVNELGRSYYFFAVEDNHTHLCDLQVGIGVDSATPDVGQQVTYTVSLLNDGPEDGTGIAVTAMLPAGLTFVSSDPDAGTYDDVTGIWTVGDLHKHVAATLAITALVEAGAAGQTLTTTATVTDLVESDTDGSNNSASVDVTVAGTDLAVAMTVDNPMPNVSQPVHFTVTLTNNGPLPAGGVQLQVAWPVGLTFSSASPGAGSYNPNTRVWTVGSIAVGATVSLVITARPAVGTDGQTLVVSTAIIASDLGDPVEANNSASASLTVTTTSSDLAVQIVTSDAQPDEGQAITLTTTVTNNGPDDDTGVALAVALPAGLTHTGDLASTGTFDPVTGAWVVGNLADGAVATLQITAIVDAGTGGLTLTTTASVTASDQQDPVAANDTANVGVTVTMADLGVSITADNPSPNQGDPVTFTVTLRDNGPDAATGIAIVVALPPELTFVSSAPASGTYDAGTGTWSIPALAAGGVTTLQVLTNVTGVIGGENLTTTATITAADQSDPVASNDAASVSIGVTVADLVIDLAASDLTPDEGQTVTLTTTLTNVGPDDGTGIHVAVSLPSALVYASHTASAGTYDVPTGRWLIDGLAMGDTATLQVDVVVAAGTAGRTFTAATEITSADQSDPTFLDNAASVDLAVTNSDLEIAYAVSDVTPDEGQPITATVTLTNHGPDDASGVGVGVALPAGLTYVASTPGSGTYDDATGLWSVGPLAAGTTTTLQVNASVDAGTAGAALVTSAVVASADQGDADATNNAVNIELTVTSVDLAVGITASDQAPDETEDVTFLVTVTNAGPDDGSGVAVHVALPAGLTYGSDAASIGTYDGGSGQWTVGDLAAGAVDTLRITATVDAGTAGTTLVTTATVAACDQGDPDDSDNEGSVAVTVTSADLAVTLAVDDATPGEGQTITYSVVLTNDGPDPATGIGVSVALPAGVTLVSSSSASGTYDAGSGQWALSQLGADGSAVLLLMATVNSGTDGNVLIASAQISACDQGDPMPGNNAASLPITISGQQAVVAQIRPFTDLQRRLLPGGAADDVLRIDVINSSDAALPLNAITFTNPLTGIDDQAVQDAAWQSLDLYQRTGRDRVPVPILPGGVNHGTFSAGVLTFSGLDVAAAASDTLHLILRGAAALEAADALELKPTVPLADALSFTRDVPVDGTWPLVPNGVLAVDGMTAAQITLHEIDADAVVFQIGSTRNLALDVTVPSNGGYEDHLTRLNVRNWGTAAPATELTRVEAWADDGDGQFDAAGDVRIGDLNWTGDRWEATGLWVLVPAPGLRIMVTVDVAEDALGGSIRLGLPAGDDTGVGMDSGNDGPIDDPVINGSEQNISSTDRVIATVSPIASQILAPGQTAVPLLHLLARNLYADPQYLSSVRVRNLSRGQGGATQAQRDSLLTQVNLRADGNGDGVLGSLDVDPLLGSAVFSGGVAEFRGLHWNLPPDGVSHLFVTGTVTLTRAADGDTVAAVVGSGSDLQFEEAVALVGSWPLDCGARHVIDGMVAAQIKCPAVPPVSLTAGDGPVLAFDLTIPANGYLADTLSQLRLVNRGSATTTDIASLQLWADDGDGIFEPGTDVALGAMAGVDTTWVAPSLDVPIPTRGLRVFAGLTVTATPSDSATVRLAVPANGVTVASNDDGPRDIAVTSPTSLLISTAPLLANLQIAPVQSTVGQAITLTMTVMNVSGEDVNGIVPLDVTVTGDGGLSLQGGPTPTSLDLVSGATGSFSWTFVATAIGHVQVSGHCEGTGAVGGQVRRSLQSTSGAHEILYPASGLNLYPVANMPVSINRGQTGVVPLTMTFVNDGDDDTADVRLTRLIATLDNGSGGSVIPADLLSRVTVSEGVDVYCVRTSLETSGNTITLDLAPPVIVTTSEPVTLSLRLDILAATSVAAFRVILGGASSFTAVDHINGNPLTVTMPQAAFPYSSGTGHLVAQATGLVVHGPTMAPATAGEGQAGVELLQLDLEGVGDPAFPSDVQIGSFTVSITDTLGRRLADTWSRVNRLRVVGPLAVHAEVALTDAADSVVTFQLLPPVAVPVSSQHVTISIRGRIPADATLGPVRLHLEDAALFDARDGNVGASVPVTYDPLVITGPTVTIQAPVTAVSVAATPQLPPLINLGARGIQALTLHVVHTGDADVATAVIDTLRLVCLDDRRQPLDPAALCDRIRVQWQGAICADLPPPTVASGVVRLPLSAVQLAAGQTGDLEVLIDLETTAPAEGFEIVVPDTGLVGHDINLGTMVSLEPAAGTNPPYSSGLAHIVVSAEELLVGFVDRMPALVAGDGELVMVGELTLRNTAPPTSGSLVLRSLTLRAADDELVSRPLGALCGEIVARVGDVDWAAAGDLAATDSVAVLTATVPLDVPPASVVTVTLLARMRSDATGGLRLGFTETDVDASQPNGAAGVVRVRPEPGAAFPFWSAAGHFSDLDLAASYVNFPNPFAAGRATTTFAFVLAQPAQVTLRIYSARGDDVARLLDGRDLASGLHQDVTWDGRNGRGETVHNGVYLAELVVRYADGSQDRRLRKVAVVR